MDASVRCKSLTSSLGVTSGASAGRRASSRPTRLSALAAAAPSRQGYYVAGSVRFIRRNSDVLLLDGGTDLFYARPGR